MTGVTRKNDSLDVDSPSMADRREGRGINLLDWVEERGGWLPWQPKRNDRKIWKPFSTRDFSSLLKLRARALLKTNSK